MKGPEIWKLPYIYMFYKTKFSVIYFKWKQSYIDDVWIVRNIWFYVLYGLINHLLIYLLFGRDQALFWILCTKQQFFL